MSDPSSRRVPRWLTRAAISVTVLSVTACATLPRLVPGAPVCAETFARMDAALAADELRDAASHSPVGFPYLRLNRFLASFVDELDAVTWPVWLERARQLDLVARQTELSRLLAPAEATQALNELRACGAHWLRQDLEDPQRLADLRRQAGVPDDYSILARTLGGYPLARPFLTAGINGFRAELRGDYALPLDQVQGQAAWQLWQLPGEAGSEAGIGQPDALGIPQLAEAQWEALFARHAPAFLIASDAAYDRPGMPGRMMDGALRWQDSPTVYLQAGYTRFYDQVLVQLSYVIWFSERPPQSRFDPYAGPLDGVMWRVTLDGQGLPLVYDTAHACGCYHYVYPARQLRRRPGSSGQETAMQPQGQLPWAELALVLSSGEHYVRRVLPLDLARQWAQAHHSLNLRPYADLSRLPATDGRTRSLFDADGLVSGSERGERFWLWPTGVVSPGAMRQWGRHATAFIGRAHFDDARLLETWFLSP